MGIVSISVLSALMGVVSYAIGTLPLFFTFTKSRIEYLSAVGTGLLLGAALGIIIPEGIEALISTSNGSSPSKKTALSLLSGFAFMLLVEQLSSGHDHEHHAHHPYTHMPPHSRPSETLLTVQGPPRAHSPRMINRDNNDVVDISLSELGHGRMGTADDNEGIEASSGVITTANIQTQESARASALPLTIGLVIHSLTDGLALGASALPRTGKTGQSTATEPNAQISFLVFFAIAVHKAPTVLGFTISLLSKSLPPSECRKYICAFSASTPIGAVLSFGILSALGAGSSGDWTGIALLVSGGSFLYVATVLQPVSHQDQIHQQSHGMNPKIRVVLICLGMFIPFWISLIIDHED